LLSVVSPALAADPVFARAVEAEVMALS